MTSSLRRLRRVPHPVLRWAEERAQRWSEASVQGSRRNAMVAATALTQRRIEAREVADYLASLHGPATGIPDDLHGDAAHARR